jgi:hypothetical protein
MPELNITPDEPVSFGRKCSWLVVQSNDPLEVAESLNLIDVQVSGWRTGIDAAYKNSVFVSPPVKKWVLIVSNDLPYTGDQNHVDLCTPLLLELGQRFPEVQFFATHRITSYCAWARIIDGRIIRQYSWGDGQSAWNVGAVTPEEVALNMHYKDSSEIDWPEDEDAEWELIENNPIPGEDDVLRIAGAWGIDPSTLAQQNLLPGIGYLGKFPQVVITK